MATTAGERTNYRRQASIYKTTAKSAASSEYSSYDTAYVVDNGCLRSAASYSGFLDMVKGKHIINPQLDGAPAAKAEVWAGNFIAIDLSGASNPSVTSISALGTGGNIEYGNSNRVVFPAIDYSPGTGLGGGQNYPGWVMDPSASAMIECLSDTSVPIYFERFGKVSYRSSQAYWDAVRNGDLLNGMQYPSRVSFAYQATDLSSATALTYAPESSFGVLDPSAQLARWCSPGAVPPELPSTVYRIAVNATVSSQWPTSFALDISSYSAAYGSSDPYYTDLFALYSLMVSLTSTIEALKADNGLGTSDEVRILVGEYNSSDTLVSSNSGLPPGGTSGSSGSEGYSEGYNSGTGKIYGYLSYQPGVNSTDSNGFLYPASSPVGGSTVTAGSITPPSNGTTVPLFFLTASATGDLLNSDLVYTW